MERLPHPAQWRDPSRYLDRIYLEASCAGDRIAEEIIRRAALPVTIVAEADIGAIVAGHYPENLGNGKRNLLLCRNRGGFLKSCPATREYRCCDYQVINIGMGCPMDCVYCILQAYLNNPYLSFFVNHDDLFAELAEQLAPADVPFRRIGTGEFTDSLALDRLTGLSRRLVTFFAGQTRAVLELKTKSGMIDNLEDLEHKGRTIVSWSLNSAAVIDREEFRVATLDERLAAAARCADWGYPLAFHFDPVIAHSGWRTGYAAVIRQLFDTVPAAAIRWISIGAFRFLPGLKRIAALRFPQSTIFSEEFIEGLDAKQRYFRPFRITLYEEIYRQLRRRADPRTCIYFCMESDEIWKEVMGFAPADRGGLPAMLDATLTAF